MKWIGLTGGIASGKSTVAQILKDQGLPVVDADQIAKAVVELSQPGFGQVVDHFGKTILKPDGSLDRKKLGQMVFTDPTKLLELEKILHPLVQTETLKQKQSFEKNGHAFAFYDVPLLFEKNLEGQFDAIVVVASSEDLQKMRMKSRDSLSDVEISDRLKSQIPISSKIKKATWVIQNDGTLEDLRKETLEVLKKIQSGKA